MTILINFLERNGKTVVAICDEELLGKKYKEGEICLDLIRYRSFYEGKKIEELNEDEIKDKFKSASSINIVGNKSLKLIEKYGFDVSHKKLIGKEKIPHLQIYRI